MSRETERLGLPRDREHPTFLLCPWCDADVDNATVRLEALFYAHCDDCLTRPERDETGCARDPCLTADCPSCAKPFMIALRRDGGARYLRLMAVRTAKDARLLAETPIAAPIEADLRDAGLL